MKRSSGPRKTASLSESVNYQLNMYALAASAAGVGLLASASCAEAKVVYTPTHKIINRIMNSFTLDLNHDGKGDFTLDRISGGDLSYTHQSLIVDPYRGYSANGIIATAIGTGRPAIALRVGARIGPRRLFNGRITVMAGHGTVSRTSRYTYWFGQWGNGGKGLKNRYLGLKFRFDGQFHFGWARVTVTTSGKRFKGILTGYAYETIPNKPIIAGKTKGPDTMTVQPASLGHLAAGASAIPAWRSKR